VVLAVLGGLATWLAFPSPGWWPLAVVGVALLALAVTGRSVRAGAGLGLLYGLAFFVPLLRWSGVYVGALPWLALSTLEALYLALLGGLLAPLLRLAVAGATGRRPRTLARAVLVPAAAGALWVGQEALRDRTPFGGFPWGRLAFSQADAPFAALAALGGAPIVTFAVAWCGSALAVGVLAALRARPAPRSSARAGTRAAVRAAAPALVLAAGCAASGLLVPLPTSGDPVQVAGVQGDVPEAGLDFSAERRAVLDNHARGTRELAARVATGQAARPDVVIWPENASDLDPYRQADARAVIDDAVDAIGVPTLVGAVLTEPADRLTNASIVWTPGAGPGARYAKRHPVPFGEYIPYRSFFRTFSSQVDLVRRDFAPGTAVGALDLGPVRAGVTICFEVAYDDLVRDTVRDGADLLVVQTNNATFGYTDEAVQQLAMSRLRAIEHGRAVAHVSTVGVSALIAPDGRELVRTSLFTPAILQAQLPRRTALTVADRLGGWPEAVLTVGGLLAALLAALLTRGRADRRGTPGGRTGRGRGRLQSSATGGRTEDAPALAEAR
jgi:apolipoprotein N-acyltransferase